MSDVVDFDDEWVTSIYENCATTMEGLQAKEELSAEEQGLNNLCEVIVYLYGEVYQDPQYIRASVAADTRVLH